MKIRNKKEKIRNEGFSSEHLTFLKKQKRKKIIILACQTGLLVILAGLWELLTYFNIMDPFITSSPSRIFKTLGVLLSEGSLFKHIGVTLYECVLGFVIATALGVVIAAALWWSDTAKKILDPYIVVLNSLPKVALGPIIIIWVGLGSQAIIMMAVLISVIVTILSVLNGFLSCDKDKILLMRSMGANKGQILFKLILPHALPDMISALKINVGLSWVGTIMGEYLVSRAGLGYLIINGGLFFKLDIVMTSIVVLCVLAAIMYFGVAILEKWIYKRRRG